MAHPLARPRWIVLTLIVVVLVVVMVNLGFWQLRRLDERRDRNALIEARQDQPVTPIDEVVDPGAAVTTGDDVVFRRVVASGTFDLDDEVLLRGRDLDGTPGFWVLTPLDLGDGTAVVVNRGWIPFREATDGSDVEYDRPAGPVTVTGTLEEHVPGAVPAGDARTTIAHLDLEWFDDELAADVYPVAIRLEDQEPARVGDRPVVLDPPVLDDGPHLSYAVQWFLFAAVAVIGFPLLLRRQVQDARRGSGPADPSAPVAAPPQPVEDVRA